MLEVKGALVAGHAVEQHLQHPPQDTLLRLCHWYRLKGKGHIIRARQGLWIYICAYSHAWIYKESPFPLLTCTTISKVSRIVKLASVARLPSMSASCSSSALVLQSTEQRTLSQNGSHLPNCDDNAVHYSLTWGSCHDIQALVHSLCVE